VSNAFNDSWPDSVSAWIVEGPEGSTAVFVHLGLNGAIEWLWLSAGTSSCLPLLRGIPAKMYELEVMWTFKRIRKKMKRIYER